MPREIKSEFKAFSAEFLVYLGLVVGYCLLVLRYLAGWLAGLFHHERKLYAGLALALIVVQGLVLSRLTTVLLRLARWGRKELK